MDWEFFIKLVIEVISILGLFYLVFYKSFLKELGKQKAKILSSEELTTIQENVKQDFRTQIEIVKSNLFENLSTKIESLKSDLQRNNISYQISLAELTKIRFIKIEDLFLNLLDLQEYIKEKMFWIENKNDFTNIKNEFNEKYKKANKSRQICELYLNDELSSKIINVLNNSHDAYLSFVKMYHTNPKQYKDTPYWNLDMQKIKLDMGNENQKAFVKLNDEIEKFPKVLNELSTEFKKEIIFKNIEL